MYGLNSLGENSGVIDFIKDRVSINKRRRIDAYQISLTTYIRNNYFPWLCIVLLQNRKNLKRPVTLVLILYWFLQSTGDLLQSYLNYTNIKEFEDRGYDWPFNKFNWYVVNAVAHTCWTSGEIIADWYPLLRTRAIIKDKKKMIPIYFICILYNLVKVLLMLTNYVFAPSSFERENDKPNKEMLRYIIVWWSLIAIIQMVSLLYDLMIIIALKKTLFNKLESFKHSFLEKFKQISELRIFISVVISIIFIPWAIIQVCFYIVWYIDPQKGLNNINNQVEHFRIIGLRFVYTFIYVDQILLRFYVNRNNANQYFTNSTKSSSRDSELLIIPSTSVSPKSIIYNANPINSINGKALCLYKSNTINEQDISKSLNNNSNLMQYDNKNNDDIEFKSYSYFQNLKNIKNPCLQNEYY